MLMVDSDDNDQEMFKRVAAAWRPKFQKSKLLWTGGCVILTIVLLRW